MLLFIESVALTICVFSDIHKMEALKVSFYELSFGIKVIVAIWVIIMAFLYLKMWYYKAEYSPDSSVSRAEEKKKSAVGILKSAIVVLIIVKIADAVGSRTIDLFMVQQIMIGLSLIALLPVIMRISGRSVSEKILNEVPRISFMGIAMAGAIERLEFSFYTLAEIVAAIIIILVVIGKWHLFMIKQKDAAGIAR
jgi:hypothetical protein